MADDVMVDAETMSVGNVQTFGAGAGGFRKPKPRHRTVTCRDQFGRPYTVNIELASGAPTGVIIPEFAAPLAVPQTMLTWHEQKPYDLVIDFPRWKAEAREARKEHQQIFDRLIRARYGLTTPSDEQLRLAREDVGAPPTDYRLIELLEEGDPYLLGRTQTKTRGVIQIESGLAGGDVLSERNRIASLNALPAIDEVPMDPRDRLDADRAADLDEQFDPDATGGKRMTVRSSARRRGAGE